MIYTYDNKSVYVNLFIQSELNWKEKGISIKQLTKIPDEEQTILEIYVDSPKEFSLKIRHPYWVEKGKLKILVNGKTINTASSPSQFAEIKRVWRAGDRVTVQLPMTLRIEPLSPSQKFLSVSYGPVVLAAKYPSGDLNKSDFWHEYDNPGTRTSLIHFFSIENFSWFTGSYSNIAKKIIKTSSSPLTFRTESASYPDSYTLIPFNKIHFSRYVLYFPYNQTVEEVAKRMDANVELNKATIDAVHLAYSVSEQDHKLEFISSRTGWEFGYSWRQAIDGGYFMFNLKSDPNERQSLQLMFRSDESGNKTFDIQIDGKLLKTINHNNPAENVTTPLYTEIIPIPYEMTRGKTNISVKFQAKPDNSTGGIFDIRTVKTSYLPVNSL
jgi:hypothetical protein